MKRKLDGYPLWAAYFTLPPGEKRGDTWHQPVKVVLHKRRAMLWLLLTRRVRLSRS